MTGFGQAIVKSDRYEITCECTSVNRKHLDVHVRLPSDLGALEPEIRNLAHSLHVRGNITVSCAVRILHIDESTLNREYVFEQQAKLESLANLIGFELDKKTLFSCLHHDKHSWHLPKDTVSSIVLEAAQSALIDLNLSKQAEGQKLKTDFIFRIEAIEACLVKMKENAIAHSDRAKDRIVQLLLRFGVGHHFEDPKVVQEFASIIEKADISEELHRVQCHLDRMRQVIEMPSSGKHIEFILQELLREWNTMGSKVQDIQMTQTVIDAKCEIERLREQVQNVE